MSNKIPTFEELAEADEWCDGDQLSISQMAELSRKHTTLHVQAALEAQAKRVIESWESLPGNKNYSPREISAWLKDDMAPMINKLREDPTNAYPLTNIV